MLMACPLGRNFSIVSFSTRLESWYRESVEWHGMQHRLASIRMLDAPFTDVDSVQSELENMLLELAHRAITEDEADVIITAGAPLAGLAHRVRDRIPVPMVEGGMRFCENGRSTMCPQSCHTYGWIVQAPCQKTDKRLIQRPI